MSIKITPAQAEMLCAWYRKNKRQLPWRDTGDPYDVWLSEIMLQQTRIEAVRDKFIDFRKELPDIASLAACDDDRLMRLWEGLGYYSRARNLKKCAQAVMEKHGGKLPDTKEELLKLPGIGPYTAGAIASIAYEKPEPAVDGNVLRILARIAGCRDDIREESTKMNLAEMLDEAYAPDVNASDLTQALMELGQTVCVPNGVPKCDVCPWSSFCNAHLNNETAQIPYRSRLKERKIEQRTLLVIRDGNRFLLHKRSAKGLLAGLYEFYGLNGWLSEKEILSAVSDLGFTPLRIHPLPESKHIFTHLEWHMKAYEIMCEECSVLPDDSFLLAEKKELQFLAVPSAFRTYTDWYSLRD